MRLSESFLLPMSPGRINPTADNLEVTTCGKDPREVWGHTTQEAVGLRLEGKDIYPRDLLLILNLLMVILQSITAMQCECIDGLEEIGRYCLG